jgi:hypothetical protein
MTTNAKRLTVEQLEDRSMPSTSGVPWPNADHLKVSFAPDGTLVDGYSSQLFQTLNPVADTSAWETELLRGLQTWAVQANINFGLIADSGLPAGGAGAIEGSRAFGDVRVEAHPLASDVVAMSSPYDQLGGNRSGDMVLNTGFAFGVGPQGGQGGYDLFSVALHEAGLILGLPENNEPDSAMYYLYNGIRVGLSANDISRIQALYGARPADAYEGAAGNDSLAAASRIYLPDIAADVSSSADVDFYKYTLPFYSSSSVTVTVQTSGYSLLAPRLTVFNPAGQVVGSVASADPLAGGVSFQLTGAFPGGTYYFKVEGARPDVFGAGAYRLKINSDAISSAMIGAIDAIMDGTYLTVPQYDGHSNDIIATATNLTQASYQADKRFDFAVTARVEDATDVDFYKVVAPTPPDGQPRAMVVSVAALANSNLTPSVAVFDAFGNRVSAEILTNDGTSYLVQVRNVAPQTTYYLQVSAGTTDSNHNVGSYLLGVNYRATPIILTQLVNNTLTDAASQDVRALNVQGTQVTHLVLSAAAQGATAATAVRMVIYDQNNNVVFVLDARDGQTVSADVFLKAGTYKVRFVAATIDGSALPALTYNLSARSLTDHLDPLPVDPNDPTLTPPPLPLPPDPITVVVDPNLVPPPPDPLSNPWLPPPPITPPT